jgi:hypothetical protein
MKSEVIYMQKKGELSAIWTILAIVGVVFVVLAVASATGITGWVLSAGDGGSGEGKYDYTGQNVDHTLKSSNKYTAAAVDPTFYIYDEQPDGWDDGRVSLEDGYISSAASSSGSAVMTETPGTYYVRGILSGYYDEFFVVEVQSSGDVALSEFNENDGGLTKVQLIDVETLSVANQDMGIATNETSDKTYHVFTNFNVDDDVGYCLDEIKLREDATYSFATDTDGNGIYDEGINKIDFIIGGKTHTVFDVAGSIDEFSGDNEAIVNIGGELFSENDVVSMKFEVTCDQTLDTTGDGDEKCGNGEDFLDDVILVDCAGNTATFHLNG